MQIAKAAETAFIINNHANALNAKKTAALLGVTHHTLYRVKKPDYRLDYSTLVVANKYTNKYNRCGECFYVAESIKQLQRDPEIITAREKLKKSRARFSQLNDIKYIIQ